MIKKMMFCTAVFAIATVNASIQLDIDLHINEVETEYERTIQRTISLENDESVLLDHNDLLLQISAYEANDKDVVVECAVIRLNEALDQLNNDEDSDTFATLLAQPVSRVEWDQPAVITLGNEKGDSLELMVTAHQNNDN